MLRYFPLRMMGAVVIAIVVAMLCIGGWSWATGSNAFLDLYGFLAYFLCLVAALVVFTKLFERGAERRVLAMAALYDNECEPRKFLEAARRCLGTLRAPLNVEGGWLASLGGQAALDCGDTAEAQRFLALIRESLPVAKKPAVAVGLLTNGLPLIQKLEGDKAALDAVEEALKVVGPLSTPESYSQRGYLTAQKSFLQERINGDWQPLLALYRALRANEATPRRLRVEYAWDEARIDFLLRLRDEERECLQEIVKEGSALAMVPAARARLNELDA